MVTNHQKGQTVVESRHGMVRGSSELGLMGIVFFTCIGIFSRLGASGVAKTKWKIERWMRDIVTAGFSADDRGHTRGLRELVITECAELDLALADLLSKRLFGSEDKINEFLDAGGDGRGPAGSFGARIQLAHHVGLITSTEVELFRLLKKLRNDFAHKYNCGWDTPRVQQTTLALFGCVIKVGIERGTINGTIRRATVADTGVPELMGISTESGVKSHVLLATSFLRDRLSQLYKPMPRIRPLPSSKKWFERLER